MKKLLLLTLSSVFILSGCQKNGDTKPVDVNDLAEKIVETDAFDDSLSQTEPEVANMLFNFDSEKITDMSCYMNTGATPEMVVVIKTEDDYKQEAIDLLNEYINSEKENFESYSPEQVVKIENVVLEEVSDSVAVCISNNSEKITEVINNYN